MLNKKEILNSIMSNREGLEDFRLETTPWKYDTPYKCVVLNLTQSNSSYVFDIGICISEDENVFVQEQFHFFTSEKAMKYLSRFLNKAFPQCREYSAKDIIGRSFIGQITQQGEYNNIVAVDKCDNPVIDDFALEFDDAVSGVEGGVFID